jgi:hypothetical protein
VLGRVDAVTLGGGPTAIFSSMPKREPIPELKHQVGEELIRVMASWNGPDLAVWLLTDAPRIKDLQCGRLDRFSLETLLRYAYALRRRPKLVFEDRGRVLPPARLNK